MANLPGEFNGFAGAKSQVFSVNGAGHLDIDASCPVAILRGDANKISIEIDADSKDMPHFEIHQQGDKISIYQQRSSASGAKTIISGHGSISFNISGGNVSIGSISVGGKEIKQEQQNPGLSTKKPRIVIKVPANGNLTAKMNGSSSLFSSAPHNEAHLNLSGQVKAEVTAQTMKIKASGELEVQATLSGGDLDVHSTGKSSIQVNGHFAKVNAELCGAGIIETTGPVRGNYSATAIGSGKIVHRGEIQGHVSKDRNGAASINLG